MEHPDIERLLDKTKSQVFLGSNAAFYGSVICSLDFKWSDSVPTAATDGITFWWNPDFFMSLSEPTRKTVMMHELDHVARLHPLRQGERQHKEWVMACDHRINLDLEAAGYSFEKIEWAFKNPIYRNMAEEEIYDAIIKNPPPAGSSFEPDLLEGAEGVTLDQIKQHIMDAVVRATQAAGAGNAPGDTQKLLDKFLAPVVPWQSVLGDFFEDMVSDDISWQKPNKRFPDVYMPSRCGVEDTLKEIAFYFDVSASVTDEQVTRFISEVKYLKDVYSPEKLTLIQFDTRISKVTVIDRDSDFEGLNVHGRGGTSLRCVKADIEEHKPSAVIIFSDLDCAPMEQPKWPVEIIWIVINSTTRPSYGRVAYISA